LTHFLGDAVRTRRVAAVAALITVAASLVATTTARAAAVATLYVDNTSAACSDTGSGSQTAPFCTIQAAANVVNPGQTVRIGEGVYNNEVDITRSGTAEAPITFAGLPFSRSTYSWPTRIGFNGSTPIGTHDIAVTGASYINIDSIETARPASSSIAITDSSHVSITNSDIDGAYPTALPAIEIAGASSNDTLRGNYIVAVGAGVQIDSTVLDTVVASNKLGATANEVVVSGASGTDVVGNTGMGSCGPEVDIQGAAAATVIENNILMGDSGCPDGSSNVGISVAAAARASTHSDYNDLGGMSPGSSGSYVWAGTTYAAGQAAAFRAQTGQGAHDDFAAYDNNNENQPFIDSADSAAPGETWNDPNNLPVDDPLVPNTGAGSRTYYDRGATEFQDSITSVKVTASPGSVALGATVTAAVSAQDAWSQISGYTYSVDFGDGTVITGTSPTVSHTYPSSGTYHVTGNASKGSAFRADMTGSTIVVGSGAFSTPGLTATAYGALSFDMDATKVSEPWTVAQYRFDYGDSTTAEVNSTGAISHTYSRPGTYVVSVTLSDGGSNSAIAKMSVTTLGTDYVAYGPVRVLDTRKGIGTSGSTSAVAAGATLKLRIGGAAGMPVHVGAVALNLTVTGPKAGGYLTAYPSGTPRPSTSSLNFSAGQTVADLAVVPVGPDGTIELYNGSGGTAALIADVSGYFTAAAAQEYRGTTPDRMLDTRDGTGGYPYSTVRQGTPVRLKVADVGAIPANVTAVALNLTVAGPASGGYVSAYPDGQSQPTVSNLNFGSGHTVANAAIVPVGQDGYIDLSIAGGPARLIADVYGYFSSTPASSYVPVTPFRRLDSRQTAGGALPSGNAYIVQISQGLGRLDPNAVLTGLVLNTTVTDTKAGGFLTVFPDNSDLGNQPPIVPNTSTLNFAPHDTTANLALPLVPSDNAVDFYNGSGDSLQLIVDVYGYFVAIGP
jgi:hypothetical protein